MTSPFVELVQAFSVRVGARLAPDWATNASSDLLLTDPDALAELSSVVGWEPPVVTSRKPKPQHFPFLAYVPATGWGIADQWIDEFELRILTAKGVVSSPWNDVSQLARPAFPDTALAPANQRAFSIFAKALLGQRRLLVEATIATVVLNIIALATSLYSMQVYDRVIPHSGFDTLWVLTAGMILALVVDFLMRTSRAFLVDREAGDIDAKMSEFFFARMQAVRLDARPPGIGTMAAQLRGLDQIRSMMTSASFFVLADLPFSILFIIVMATIGGKAALVPLAIFPISLIAAYVFARLIRNDTDKAQVSGNRKNGILVEALDSAETIKSNLGGWHMLSGWNRLVETVHDHDQQVRRWSTIASSTFGMLQQISYVGVIVAGVGLVSSGELTMGGLIACSIICGRINGPLVASLPNLVVQWGYTRSSLKALDSLLAMPTEHPVGTMPIRVGKLIPQIKLDTVTFKHRGTRDGIDIPALNIPAGARFGLIGPVGSGKSTLMRLMAGLYRAHTGHVLINGVDVGQIAEDDLRSQCCSIAQEYSLISGTLRENIILGLPDPGDEAIMAVAAETGLANVIQNHPSGLDLPILEGGRGLSGGQRTLVGLTRAILAKPRLLLLDEPTANLDQETEMRVLSALFNAVGPDGTIIMTTHKIPLLRFVHDVVVMSGGKILLNGPTNAVLEKLRPQPAARNAQAAPVAQPTALNRVS